MSRTLARGLLTRLLLPLVLVLPACDGAGDEPLGPEQLEAAEVHFYLAAPNVLKTVVVEVSAFDLPDTLVYNFNLNDDGVVSTFLPIPVGNSRLITVRGFNPQGIETHRGARAINVALSGNPTLTIEMLPLRGGVPIIIVLGTYDVAVTPATLEVEYLDYGILNATVTDALDSVIAFPFLGWATKNPAFVIAKPFGSGTGAVGGVRPGSADVIATYLDASEHATVTVVNRLGTHFESSLPNDDLASSRYFFLRGRGEITAGDVDFWHTRLGRGAVVEIRGNAQILGSTDLFSYLELYNDANVRLASAFFGGPAGDPKINYTVTRTATYDIAIGPRCTTCVGFYGLILHVTAPAGDTTESEPNGTLAEADTVPVDDLVAGEIATSGDLDYYAFSVAADTTVTIDALARAYGSRLDTTLRLYNSSGTELVANFNGPSGDGDAQIVRSVTAGTYSVQVSGFGTGLYRLLISQ